jgi:two-component system, LuxR family, response regulator FixJ
VEIYRANMMEKLRVRSLSEALRIAFLAEDSAGPVFDMPRSIKQ